MVGRLEGDAERALLRARNGLRYLAGTSRPELGQTPKDTVWRRDKAELWRYRGAAAPTIGPPLLIVHSLVSRSYVLDLLPGNSLVEFLLGEGFDVYLLDWGVADAVDAENTLESYVDDALPRAVRAVLSSSGADEVTLAGYCFGGVLTLLLAAGHPELPIRNLLTLATPGDYRHIGLSSRLFGEGRLDPDAIIDATGNVPAAVFDDGFGLLKPTDRLVQYANVWQNLWNDRFMEGYQAMNRWVHDQVPFPGAAFRQTVQMLMRDNALMNGTARLGGRPIDLRAITCPYVNVVAEKDTIVPIEAAEALSQVVGSGEVEEMRLTTGHVGFVFGRQAATSTHPRLADWLRRHSDAPAEAA